MGRPQSRVRPVLIPVRSGMRRGVWVYGSLSPGRPVDYRFPRACGHAVVQGVLKVLPVGGGTMGPSAQTYLNAPAERLLIVLEHKQGADAYVRR